MTRNYSTTDPERIKPMIELLKKQWEEHPQIRLGQLIVIISDRTDPFYIEDDIMERRMKEFKF